MTKTTVFLVSTVWLIALMFFGGFFVLAEKEEQPTLRDKLSQPIPMVASFEVRAKHHGVHELANVNGDKRDVGDYALEGDYEIGDVVTVLFATEDSTEIAGDVLVGTANELDLPHRRDSK